MITTQTVDLFGNLITNQQALVTTCYTIETFNNGSLKQLEDYKDNIFFNGTYFMDDTENLQDVIDSIVIPSGKAWSILMNKQTSTSYMQWDVNKYSVNGRLSWQAIQVFNSNYWTIMFAALDSLNKLTSNKPQKYYFGNQANNEIQDCLLMFDYNTRGSISSIYDINDNWGCQWRGLSMDEFMNSPIANDFSFDDHPYYQTLQPYLPNSETL